MKQRSAFVLYSVAKTSPKMLLRRLTAINFRPGLNFRQFSSTILTYQGRPTVDKHYKPYRDRNTPTELTGANPNEFPTHCDVAIVGGGGMGSSSAYFLKKKAGHDLNVVVIEKDFTYSRASTPLSAGCLRQQFTVQENVLMSQFGAEFLQSFRHEIGDEVDPNFKSNGNLFLVNQKNAERLWQAVELQNDLGVNSQLLFPEDVKEMFPWINTDGVYLASYGRENEGWFDPWALLMGLRKKAQSLGAQYVEAEVVDFGFKPSQGEYESVEKIIVKTAANEQKEIHCNICVLSAGAQTGQIAKKAKIGSGPGLLSTPLPIEPRKRYIYVLNSQGDNVPPPTAPLVLDTSQLYFRREGANFICGRSPPSDEEPPIDNLDVDLDYFESDMWPDLAHRVPAFQSLKVVGAWAGFYEYNKFDQNGVIGKHPAYDNLYIAAGFSGHGVQKVPAVGQSIAELIVDGDFLTIDLSLLNFDRIIENKPIQEMAIA